MFNIIGTIFGTSGYDVHTRNLFNALYKIEKCSLITQLFQGFEKLVNDNELEAIKSKKGDINIIITNPVNWRTNCDGKRNWAYLVWEGDKIPLSWIEECLNPEIEYILVPSNHTKKAIENTEGFNKEISKKIKLIPHGVDLNLFHSKEKPKDFTFIANKGFRNLQDRGGIQYLIKAYLEEFNIKENVNLIIKINPAYGIPDLNKIINQLDIKNKESAKIKFLVDSIKYEKLVDLYNSGQVFVSPTRAESFNIPCIEAMACGLPVITTNFGGQTDFVNNNNGIIISGELEEIKHEINYEGIRWLTPNINELRTAMRELYSNPEMVSSKSFESIKTAKEFTWDKSAEKIHSLLKQKHL